MTYNAIFARNLGADDHLNLVFRCAAVESGCYQNCDSLGRDAGRVQARKQRGQRDFIWRGAGNVTNGDGCRALARCHLDQGIAANGVIERVGQGC